MNPKPKNQTVGHRLIINYKGASRNAASVILTVWLVGMASWFVNANAVHTSALAIEPGVVRNISVPVSEFVKNVSAGAGVGSLENLIDRIRNRNRSGISLVDETIGSTEVSIEEPPTEIEEQPIVETTYRPGDGLIVNQVPVLDPAEFTKEKVGRTIRVLVTGDSLSTFAGQELVKLMSGDERFVVRIEWANGSGLTKPNVLDWAQYARDVTAKYQPDLVVVILGGSDTVNMINAGNLINRGSAAWVAEYSRRMQLVVDEFVANNVTNIVWAGPPPVKDSKRNLSYRQIQQSLSESARLQAPLKQLDTFSGVLPKLAADVDGKRVLLRQSDGVHWTREASRILAVQLQQMLLALRP